MPRTAMIVLLAASVLAVAPPTGALAQTDARQFPGLRDRPPPFEGGGREEPVDGGEPPGGHDPSGNGELPDDELDALPETGSEPLVLGLAGAALTLIGTGLRLRTLDADLY